MTHPGYKQTADHIAKRILIGERNPAWKGDSVSVLSARCRAERHYPPRPCADCGTSKADRHHIDGNTRNNIMSNIVFLCRRCHMKRDGRLDADGHLHLNVSKRAQQTCIHGHPFSADNTYFHKNGGRGCRTCRREYLAKYHNLELQVVK